MWNFRASYIRNRRMQQRGCFNIHMEFLELRQGLEINEPLPTYETKKRKRTRKSLVGTLYAGHDGWRMRPKAADSLL